LGSLACFQRLVNARYDNEPTCAENTFGTIQSICLKMHPLKFHKVGSGISFFTNRKKNLVFATSENDPRGYIFGS
jgi:hypothetical protein